MPEYEENLARMQERFESICVRCGDCCGSNDGDPCTELVRAVDGKYYCCDYENRLGPRQTINGNTFTCITIREVMKTGNLRPTCMYNRISLKNNSF
ncbi:MAG: hypothetical protein A2096_07575 [Spirochaetes bacterium GWF1_41_5]|nr:MAG: hypothetical protein A2096_07575 [Spirochaetes bacterium GWF1_41_5]